MNIKLKKKKYLLFVLGSWLIAKLSWTLEMSRLAFFRSHRNERIRHVMKKSELFSVHRWTYEHERISFINYDPKKDMMIFHKFPELSKN